MAGAAGRCVLRLDSRNCHMADDIGPRDLVSVSSPCPKRADDESRTPINKLTVAFM
jgi:hypothetical protein